MVQQQENTSTDLSTQNYLITTDQLTRCYGKLRAVDEVSLHIPQGKIYGFLGMNGAGKSTLISMLMGILPPTSGMMNLFGHEVKSVKPVMRSKIGFVAQEQHFYPWMKVLALGKFVSHFYPTWDDAEFLRLIKVLDIPTERKIKQLSGGNKTKLALAIALAMNPEILILDEPTTGLDPVARREFMESIVAQARNHNRTTFFSSHLVNEVEQCADIIGIIHKGKLRFEGPLELLKECTKEFFISTEAEVMVPEGLEVWLDEESEGHRRMVLHGPLENWNQLSEPWSFSAKVMSLEDIFLACVKSQVMDI